MPFKKLGLAITFSPNGQALLIEAKRLQMLFNSELILIHVGEKTREAHELLTQLIIKSGLDISSTKVIWENGDPAKVIINKCYDENIDLLLAGALEKENFLNYYIGSVARRILRSAPCSVLILTAPSTSPKPLKKFCISVDFSLESENTMKKAYEFALLENAVQFILIREFLVPGLAMTIQDSGSTQDTEKIRNQWQEEEIAKLKIFVKELNLTQIDVKIVCLYGRQGWEANKYVRDVNGDILVISGPKKELKLFDRIFQHDAEFIYKQLPCSLLVIKSGI